MENLNSDIPMFSILQEGADHFDNDNQVAEWDKKRLENEKENYFINKSNVGRKFLNKSLNDYIAETDEQKNILSVVRHFIDCVNDGKFRTLWLCGNTGTGKTLLGSSICRETMGTFCRSYNIKDDIDASRTFKATETKRMVIERYANYRLLVIDEVGRGGADERDYLWQVLNERYENEVSTVLISNLSKGELKEFLGETIYDRFVTNCISLTFTGESYRRNEREI
jgi:DNA replication protein DnaC